MAFNPIQIFPNDTKARVAIGIDLPLNGSAVFKSNYQTKDSIKSSLINYLLTNRGERIGNPDFGANLREYLFSQMVGDNLDFIKSDIQAKINKYFTNVLINSIEITQLNNNSNSIYNVSISYKILNTNISDNINIGFS